MTSTEVIDFLTYRSYRWNRLRSPQIAPERWKLIYTDAERFELQLQNEKGGEIPKIITITQ